MPNINADWNDLILDAGEVTTGWAIEVHLRTAAGATPAIKKFSTALGTIIVGQTAPSGATHGIQMDAAKTDMNFAAGTYVWDIIRTDGGRNEPLLDGGYWTDEFRDIVTNSSLA